MLWSISKLKTTPCSNRWRQWGETYLNSCRHIFSRKLTRPTQFFTSNSCPHWSFWLTTTRWMHRMLVIQKYCISFRPWLSTWVTSYSKSCQLSTTAYVLLLSQLFKVTSSFTLTLGKASSCSSWILSNTAHRAYSNLKSHYSATSFWSWSLPCSTRSLSWWTWGYSQSTPWRSFWVRAHSLPHSFTN